jgi:hypothetical protein
MGALRSRLSLVAVLAAGWLVVGSAAGARAAIPSGNLIVNGGAEAGTGSSDSSTSAPAPIPGWATTTNFTEHTYDPAGSQSFPDANVSAAIGGGSQFFAGGPAGGAGNNVETATEAVNVSIAAAEIDTGGVSATLSADLGGFASQEDQAKVTATFLGSAGQALGNLTIGPVTAQDRNNVTALLARKGSAAVPGGTRTVRVVVTATKFAGAYNDAYLDNVSLSLSGSPPPPLPLPKIGKTLDVSSFTGKVFVRLAHGHGFVPLTRAEQLPVGSQIDARRGTIQLVAASLHAGKTQTGSFGGAVFGLAQSAKVSQNALTTLSLLEGVVRGGPSYAACKARSAIDRSGPGAAAARLSSRVLQTLHASARGRFRTHGRYSAATVRGTVWDTIDRCDGTLTRVHRGTVIVSDFARHTTVTVHAGQSYLAKAP